jgi:hypothetical protein
MHIKNYTNTSNQDITCRLHISGRFFTALSSDIKPPTYCAQNNITNFWLYRTEFIQRIKNAEWNKKISVLEKSKTAQYCLLPKQYWLSELTLEDIKQGELQLFTADALAKFLSTEQLENEWHFAIIDTYRIDEQINNINTTLTIELGRFFIIN